MTLPDWLHHAIAVYGYWVVLVAVGLESTGIPFPGETALIGGAVYAGTGGRLSIVGVIAAAAAGAILGDNLGYSIGRYGGYPLLRRVARALHLNERHLELAQRYFERHGDKTVFLGRFFALLRTWAAFLAGVNQMRWRTFLFWNAAGGICWAVIYGMLGYVLGHNLPLLDRVLRVMGIGGTVALVVVIAGVLGYWYLRTRRGIDLLAVGPLGAVWARLAAWRRWRRGERPAGASAGRAKVYPRGVSARTRRALRKPTHATRRG